MDYIQPLGRNSDVRLLALAFAITPALALARSETPSRVADRHAAWPHVTKVDRCHIVLDASPRAQQDALSRAIRKRLGDVDIALSPLGDRVAAISGPLYSAGTTITRDAAISIAHDFLIDHAALLGIDDAIDGLSLRATTRRDGTGWLLSGSLYRTTASLTLSANLTVAVDAKGTLQRITIGDELLPTFTLCETPSLDPAGAKIRSKLVGTPLTYSDDAGRTRNAGPITARDLTTPVTTRILRTDHEVHRVLVFTIRRGPTTWAALVDGETGAVLRIDEQSRELDL